MNKEQPHLLKNYDFAGLAEAAFFRAEQQSRVKKLNEALNTPDKTEGYSKYEHQHMDELQTLLSLRLSVKLVPTIYSSKVTAKLFEPYEHFADTSSSAVPMEINTSVVAFDAYSNSNNQVNKDNTKIGSVVLFPLSANLPGEPAPEMSVRNLEWGSNCSYGAVVVGDDIQYFKFCQTNGERVTAEVRRKDPTEKNDESVDMRVVSKSSNCINIEKIPFSSDEMLALQDELDKFVKARQGMVASDGD